MISKYYMPILRTKQGEFSALSQIRFDVQGYLVPLIEVADMEYDNEEKKEPKTIEEHLDTVAMRIEKKWPRSNAFLDCALVRHRSPNGITPVEYIYQRLSQAVALPSLAIRLSTFEETKNSFRKIMVEQGLSELAIRIFTADILTTDFKKKIEEILTFFTITPQYVHIIFDLENADFSLIDDFSESMSEHLQTFPDFQKWKSFTLCGGAFPKSQKLAAGENLVPRGEWMFYKKVTSMLKQSGVYRDVNYGDYGIIAPGHFSFDKRKDRSANIRYTSNDVWYVMKGHSIKLNGFGQYIALANAVVNSPYYINENFSAGDKHLKEVTLKGGKPGNMTVWKKVGFNHHFTKVLDDLLATYLVV